MNDQLTDEAVTKLANDCVLAANCLEAEDTFPTGQDILREAARALIDARAERDRLRADAQAAVVLVVEQAAGAAESERRQWDHGHDISYKDWARVKAATRIRDAIRALAPADGLAAVDALRKERDSLKAFVENDADWEFSAKRRLQLFREMRADRDRLAAANAALRAERDGFRRNLRETFEAMCAMRDAINERIPMPSLESDLSRGPENSVFCSIVAQTVIADRDRLAAANAALEAQVARLVGALEHEVKRSRRHLAADTLAALAEVQADARREGGE